MHAHDHHHDLAVGKALGRAFGWGIGLNVVFVVAEAVAGAFAGSTALMADAAHNLSDVLGLALAWAANKLAARRPTSRRTYGFRRSTILAALANAGLVLAAIGAVIWESVERLREPPAVMATAVIVVAGLGVIVNGVSALLFVRAHKHDTNVRAAVLHLMADAAVSAAVVVSGGLMLWTGLPILDPITSIVVSLVVMAATWRVLREALNLALDAVPDRIDPEAISKYLDGLSGVREVHDLHIWPMSTTEVALTAHLVVPWQHCPPQLLTQVEAELHHRFGIDHVTIQFEPEGLDGPCRLAECR